MFSETYLTVSSKRQIKLRSCHFIRGSSPLPEVRRGHHSKFYTDSIFYSRSIRGTTIILVQIPHINITIVCKLYTLCRSITILRTCINSTICRHIYAFHPVSSVYSRIIAYNVGIHNYRILISPIMINWNFNKRVNSIFCPC